MVNSEEKRTGGPKDQKTKEEDRRPNNQKTKKIEE